MHYASCNVCGLRFYDSILPQDEITSIYDDGYFNSDWCWYRQPYAEAWQDRKKDFEAHQLKIIMPFKKGCRMMEVGCAGGATLKAFADAGYDTLGVELNAKMAEWGRKNLSLNIIAEDITSPDFKKTQGKFGLIYMSDVLEHINEPRALLENLRFLLEQDGVLAMDVPLFETNRFSSKIIRLYQKFKPIDTKARPDHLIFFTPSSLKIICRNAGYRIAAFHSWKEHVMTPADFAAMPWKMRTLARLDHILPRFIPRIFDDKCIIILRTG